jgi:glucosamine--fructose-6-phosphate aminotransferase (isomerizing)
MCGIFGIISGAPINLKKLNVLASHAMQRGRDSSGIIYYKNNEYRILKENHDILSLLRRNVDIKKSHICLGHSRLITNGLNDNQPVFRDKIVVLHNGIIVNDEDVWKKLDFNRNFEIDTECIIGLLLQHLSEGGKLTDFSDILFKVCVGTMSCAILLPELGKLLLLSNNGSLYYSTNEGSVCFSSELYPLKKIGMLEPIQLLNNFVLIDIPISERITSMESQNRIENLIPSLVNNSFFEKKLKHRTHNLKRCSKCILPETMPFISFDDEGICNYCKNYKPKKSKKSLDDLYKLIEPYRRISGPECIVPFSGGRDSCYSLHLLVKELKLRPITYTYDWGMVTDLARRNISRMCSTLSVENIIIADDISLKRKNIALNLNAWLKAPNLGMVSILTAGDKHFFRHAETVKMQTGINLNVWGTNPLEVTHFKAGFLGIEPNFDNKLVYMHGVKGQLNYQYLRFKAMLKSPGYFNSSLWDTLSGEYYRSFTKKQDYYHLFDFITWNENECNNILNEYGWELAPDTKSTWRIGDGTAAFYNYIYYTVAGFTEHDTFRSNQVREGQISREEALKFVEDENMPRYQNIKWYLDALSMDFTSVIDVINSIKPLY